MLAAMGKELRLQRNAGFLPTQVQIGSIYFGGGTPSLLAGEEIAGLMDHAATNFDLSQVREITLEANPDDLTGTKLDELRRAGINRLSIGVQSFFDEDLQWMNRAHRAREAESAIRCAQDAGFSNITLDLIYGYPLLSDAKWEANISKALDLDIPHISAYSMTVEPRTVLGARVRTGQQPPMDDEQSARQFEILMDQLAEAGYEHYEISNWAKPGAEAVHNSSYWKGQPYLGIGPSAHSYNGSQRQWNISNNARYMRALTEDTIPYEQETLSQHDRLNEYIMTTLRTADGLDLNWVEQHFGAESKAILVKGLRRYELQGLLKVGEAGALQESRYRLTRKGKLMADRVAADLFFS